VYLDWKPDRGASFGSCLKSRNWILSLTYNDYTCVLRANLGTKRMHVWLAH
jgi:hypothetical protein